jgi:hypothetical protein
MARSTEIWTNEKGTTIIARYFDDDDHVWVSNSSGGCHVKTGAEWRTLRDHLPLAGYRKA